jgi:putative transposase
VEKIKSISAESAIHFSTVQYTIDAMPQSLSKVIVHIIFSTKSREPWLDANVRPRMHAYLATICRDLGAEFVHTGGVANHIHIITTLPRTVSQAELIEQIKKTSSKWIKTLNTRYRAFAWQRGYGAFSVSPNHLEAVLQYVDGQKRAPSESHISGRVPRNIAKERRRFRRALCLRLKTRFAN